MSVQNEKNLIKYMLLMLGESDSAEVRLDGHHLVRFTDEMPGGFFIYRADGDEELLYANKAVVRIFGCDTIEEFRKHTGNSFRGIVYPEDLERVEKSIWEQIRKSQYDLDYVEYRIRRKDGAIRWIEDYGHYVFSEAMGGVFCVFVGDATEKHQQRQAELESISRERLRHLEVIEGLSVDYESIFYTDLNEDTFQTYRASPRVAHRVNGDVHWRQFSVFAQDYVCSWVHPEDRERVARAVDPDSIRERLSAAAAFSLRYRVIQGDKTEYLQMRLVNVGKDGSSVNQVVLGVSSVDSETRREMSRRQELEDALKRSRAAMAAKDVFLANMSHDMRTPLNAIIGLTTLAKKKVDDPEVLQGYLNQLENSGSQLLRLIDDSLEFSRAQARQDSLAEELCDLSKLANEVREALLPQAVGKGLELELDLRELECPLVYCDRQKLLNLMQRLVSNGIKYTRSGRVSLGIAQLQEAKGGFANYRLTVTDTGVGMSEEFQQRLFLPFEREQNTTESGQFGTGLGLAIVKSVVDMLGGSIQVESSPGQGSSFIVELTFRVWEPAGGQESCETLPTAASSRRILVVEDNELNRTILLELLADAGYAADSSVNGREAVELIRDSRPGQYALILMDIQMPEMDGYEATRAIRALPDPALAGIPIVAVSANSFEEDRRKSAESGMNGHLPKPVNVDELMKTIRRFADQ